MLAPGIDMTVPLGDDDDALLEATLFVSCNELVVTELEDVAIVEPIEVVEDVTTGLVEEEDVPL